MVRNDMWTVSVLSRSFQREMIIGGPIVTKRKAAEFAVNAYADRLYQVTRWHKHPVIITVAETGMQDAEYYTVTHSDNGLHLTRDK